MERWLEEARRVGRQRTKKATVNLALKEFVNRRKPREITELFGTMNPDSDYDYLRAAQYSNTCRVKGVQGSHTDFLICSCAVRLEAAIYTRDRDFERYRQVLPLLLFGKGFSPIRPVWERWLE